MYTFHSTIRNYLTWVSVGGRSVRVRFADTGGGIPFGVFRTADARVAEAIRKHPHFGRSITEQQAPPEEDEQPKDERQYAAIYPGVTRTQEANRILSEQYAVSRDTLKSKADALREADRLNISFPNLK